MPTYGYECLSCHNQFEVFQSIKDDPLKTCETCGGALRKRVYPVGIAFKGSGFYVNDYAPKSASSSGASEPKPEAAKTDGGGETKAEPKTEAKTEPAKTEAKTESKPEPKSEPKTPAAA